MDILIDITSEISRKKSWKWLRKGKFKRETESLLIAAQNNVISINYVKTKIENTQQKCRCKL